MKKNIENTPNKKEDITRKDAIKKIGNYSKYTALTALGTYMILNPQKAQAASAPSDPGTGLIFYLQNIELCQKKKKNLF